MAYFFCYEIENRFWCYDRYSNWIAEVDKPMYELLKSFGKHKFDETLALKLLTPKFSKEVVLQKLDELRSFQKQHNAFLPVDILKSDIPYNEEELVHRYQNEVRHIVFNITEDCVLRCKYCKFSGTYIGSRVHNPKSMSYDTIDKAILLIKKLYKKNKPLIVGFYGGEPLMKFTKIQYIVQQIEALFPDTEIQFGLTTNGLLLKDHQIEFFRKHNFSVKFSLDGPRIIHDRNRVNKNGHGTFERVLKNIKKIKSFDRDYFRKKVGFVVTISPPYDLPAIFNFFESFLNSEQVVILNHVDPYDTTFFDNFDMRKEREELREQLNNLTKEYISLKITNSNSLRKKLLDDYFGKSLVQLDRRQIFPLDQGWALPKCHMSSRVRPIIYYNRWKTWCL